MIAESLLLGITPFNERLCLESIVTSGIAGTWPPMEITGDRGRDWAGPRTLEALRSGVETRFTLRWNVGSDIESFVAWNRLQRDRNQIIIKVGKEGTQIDDRRIFTLLEDLPFAYCGAASASAEWGAAGARIDYSRCSFGDGHNEHGWMCAFKGEGHERLVSRRWLEFGPWRLIRGKNDLSFIQFHDLEVDDETALEQAIPGHQRMGYSADGGYIPPVVTWSVLRDVAAGSIKGLYDASSETLIQVVAGRKVAVEEMLEAAAIKVLQPLAKSVRQVAYVFIDEREARAHLHELWLHGLEVRAIVNGNEIRIDEDYHPTPSVPDWVKRLQDREGR